MEEIYGLMETLLKINDEINAIGYINRRLYENLRKEESPNPDAVYTMCVTEKYLHTLSDELKESIGKLDEFILKKKQTV